VTDQLALVTVPPNEAKLTERQRRVLQLVRETAGGISAPDVGRVLHADRHAAHGGRECSCCAANAEPCAWAEDTGRRTLARLRELGFGLIRRKTGRWEIPGVTPSPAREAREEDDIPY
jgi:hypothetical protein